MLEASLNLKDSSMLLAERERCPTFPGILAIFASRPYQREREMIPFQFYCVIELVVAYILYWPVIQSWMMQSGEDRLTPVKEILRISSSLFIHQRSISWLRSVIKRGYRIPRAALSASVTTQVTSARPMMTWPATSPIGRGGGERR